MSTTSLTVAERARSAIGLPKEIEQQLQELAKRSSDIVVIVSPQDRAQVHGALMAIKNQRIAIENAGKVARDDANKFAKAVIAEAGRLCSIIEPEEGRLFDLRKQWDDAREAEKQAKIDAEEKRLRAHQERVLYLRGSPNISSMSPPELIAEHISDLESEVVDATMQEYEQQAREAKATGLSRLRDMHAAAVSRVAEQERIKAERAELEALRAAQAKRDTEERARIAAEENAAKLAREEELRVQRAEQDRIDAELKAKRDADAAEIRAQRDKQEQDAAIERKRLADERAAFDKEQAEARRVAEEAERVKREQARLASLKKPADSEIIGVLAQHYNAPSSKVVEWILSMDLSDEEQSAA